MKTSILEDHRAAGAPAAVSVSPRTSALRAWLSVAAVAGAMLGCSPASQEGPDAAAPTGRGGHGGPESAGGGGASGASSEGGGVDATGAAGRSTGSDASVSGGGPTPVCTNACTMGATRCASGTTLETCGVGADGCTKLVASTCASGTVCERIAPADCVDPNWAAWPMPNSAGDVGHDAPNLQNLVDNLDGTVTDKVTGLMWAQDFHTSIDFGGGYCETQATTGGYTDWRTPALIELISIADFTRDEPAIDTTVFPLADVGPFWASTLRDGYGASRYMMDYWDYAGVGVSSSGGVGVDGILGQNVRCVR